jgi:similar to stage IV sporulation protein
VSLNFSHKIGSEFLQDIKNMIGGYLKVKVISHCPERFFNLCARQNIEIWDLIREDHSYTCLMSRKGFGSLASLKEKTNTKVEVLEKRGLPFFLCKYRKRKLFLCGVFLCISFLFGLSQFIWEIDVYGNGTYTKEDIIKYIDQNYVNLGTFKFRVDCADLEEKLRQRYEGIAWVSCSIDGCRLSVHIKETLDKNTKNMAKVPCDIVALKSGTITSMITQNGTPLCKKGDRVKKGQTLITGNIYIYSDSNEVLETHQTIADGEVLARTKVAYSCVFERSYYEKEYKKKKSYTYALICCGKRIPLMPEIKQKEGMDQMSERYPLKLGKTFYLPFCIEKITTRRFVPIRREYQKKEAYERAEQKIKKKAAEFQKTGKKVLKQQIDIVVGEEECRANGYFILEEPIGKIRAIRALTKKQEEKIRPTEAVLW